MTFDIQKTRRLEANQRVLSVGNEQRPGTGKLANVHPVHYRHVATALGRPSQGEKTRKKRLGIIVLPKNPREEPA